MVNRHSFLKTMISASGVSMAAQAIGFFRQILTAAYFGVARELDIFFMTYAIATLMVFTFGMIFDTVGIPHLVKALEEKGTEHFRRLTGSIFTFSIWTSLILSLIFVTLTPIVVKFLAAGFSLEERKEVWIMAFYFLPWTIISLPYYALCSFYKSSSYFTIVFVGEIIISLFSVLALFVYHPNPWYLPISYFIGYFFAFIILFVYSFRYFDRIGKIFTSEMKNVIRNFIQLFGANQVGSLSSVIERFLQSFLQPGGISALTYAQQMTTGASSLLSFREIFIVPFSSSSQRAEKLERLIIGLVVISVPVMLFMSYFSRDIIALLFQRGKFNTAAAGLTSSVFSVYALALLPSVSGLPAFRMFQVIDRIRYTGIVYFLGAINFLVFGSIFIFILKMDAEGIALMVVINSYLSSLLSFYLLRKGGINLNILRILKFLAYSAMSSLIVLAVLHFLPQGEEPLLLKMLINGCLYIALIAIALLPLKKQLFKIVYD